MSTIFFGIGILAVSISFAFTSKSLATLNKHLVTLESELSSLQRKLILCNVDYDSVRRSIDSLRFRFDYIFNQNRFIIKDKDEDLVSSETCITRFIHVDPIYEIDLRDFNAGDRIEFEEGSFGRIKIITKHVNYERKK